MRLRILRNGHRWPQKPALGLMRLIGRGEPDPVAAMALYRPEFFGRAWMHLVESTMRGPSEWSPSERELLASFVSKLNECPFCVGVHSGIGSLLLDSFPGAETLDDWRDGPFDAKVKDAFRVLEAANASRGSSEPTSAASTEALQDALYVGFIFNAINRLANAFDFQWSDDEDRMRLAKGLNGISYHVPEFLLR